MTDSQKLDLLLNKVDDVATEVQGLKVQFKKLKEQQVMISVGLKEVKEQQKMMSIELQGLNEQFVKLKKQQKITSVELQGLRSQQSNTIIEFQSYKRQYLKNVVELKEMDTIILEEVERVHNILEKHSEDLLRHSV